MTSWLHCNYCYGRKATEKFVLTTCGHVFCPKCWKVGDKCTLCHNKVTNFVNFTEQLKPEVEVFFKNPLELIKKHEQQILQVLEFQQFQQHRFQENLEARATGSSEKSDEYLEREIASLKKELQYWKKLFNCSSRSRSTTLKTPPGSPHIYNIPTPPTDDSQDSQKAVGPSTPRKPVYRASREMSPSPRRPDINLTEHQIRLKDQELELKWKLIKSLETDVCKSAEQNKQIQDEKERCEKKLLEAAEQEKVLCDQLNRLQQENFGLKQNVSELSTTKCSLEEKFEKLHLGHEQLQKKAEQSEGIIGDKDLALDNKDIQIDKFTKELQKLKADHRHSCEKLEQEKENNSKYLGQIKQLLKRNSASCNKKSSPVHSYIPYSTENFKTPNIKRVPRKQLSDDESNDSDSSGGLEIENDEIDRRIKDPKYMKTPLLFRPSPRVFGKQMGTPTGRKKLQNREASRRKPTIGGQVSSNINNKCMDTDMEFFCSAES